MLAVVVVGNCFTRKDKKNHLDSACCEWHTKHQDEKKRKKQRANKTNENASDYIGVEMCTVSQVQNEHHDSDPQFNLIFIKPILKHSIRIDPIEVILL